LFEAEETIPQLLDAVAVGDGIALPADADGEFKMAPFGFGKIGAGLRVGCDTLDR
jgi:hypothetical protein